MAERHDHNWLAQYYTDAKSTGDPASSGADSDPTLRELSTQAPAKYELGEAIGRGGMKEVWRVRDRDTRREVALARPLATDVGSGRYRRFVREGQITARLEHPNIVPIHDLGVDDAGTPFFTMRLLGGRTLEQILKQLHRGDPDALQDFGPHRLLDIYLQICRAIAYAHARGVIHRDLKPANIHVGEFGEVHVIDWGLARLRNNANEEETAEQDRVLAESLDRTLDGVLKGSPGYMAPEQVDRRIGDIDERTDIYALGGLLYSILTYRAPVRGKPLRDVMENTRKGRIVPPHRRAPGMTVPPPLEAVALKALSRRSSERYERVDDLAGDVQAYLEGYATSAERVGIARLVWLLVLRHRMLSGVIGASALLLAGLSVFTVASTRASEKSAQESRKRAEQSGARAREALADLQREQALRQQLAEPALHRLTDDAKRALRMGDFEQATKAASLAVAVGPDSAEAWMLMGLLHLAEEKFAAAAKALQKAADRAPQPSPRGRKPATKRPYTRESAMRLLELTESIPETRGSLTPAQLQPVLSRLLELSAKQKMSSDVHAVCCGILQRRNRTDWRNPEHRKLLSWAMGARNGDTSSMALRWLVGGGGLSLTINGRTDDTRRGPALNAGGELLHGLPLASLKIVGNLPAKEGRRFRGIELKRLDLSEAGQISKGAMAGVRVAELVLPPGATDKHLPWTTLQGVRKIYVCPPGKIAGQSALERKGVAVESVSEVPPLPPRQVER